jgi:SAM-dependent methyltransferase
MAVDSDFHYLDALIAKGLVEHSVLEVGSRDWNGNTAETVRKAGLSWQGCDLESGPGVDFTLDILDDRALMSIHARWPAVLCFNLLEHVYDPASALRNVLTLVEPGGVVVVCGPAIWELHQYPKDYWRPMPDFFFEFAGRHNSEVVDMTWLITEVPYFKRRQSTIRSIPFEDLPQVPNRRVATEVWSPLRANASIAIQRCLNLTGRVTRFPNVSLGVVLRAGAALEDL